jgi:hypothetical protein
MTHSAPDYQKAREIGSKYAEFQILPGLWRSAIDIEWLSGSRAPDDPIILGSRQEVFPTKVASDRRLRDCHFIHLE